MGTITNDDLATIAIDSVAQAEGNIDSSNLVFTVTLTGEVQDGFTVGISSTNATAVAGSDYTAIPALSTLNFSGTSGQTRTIAIPILGDTVLESDELFVVILGTPSNAGVTVSGGAGVGTISNDDAASLSINDMVVTEGNTGTINAVFTVTLTGATQSSFQVPVSSADGTVDPATAGSDYVAIAGVTNLNFAGTPGETHTISVVVNGDLAVEPNESFFVNLGVPTNNAIGISDGQGLGTIIDNDSPSFGKRSQR